MAVNPNSPTKNADLKFQSPNDQSDIMQVIQPNGGVVLGGHDYRGVPYGTFAQGGGGGTVGPGSVPQLAVFSSATTVSSSSVSDDGVNPTITPNGLNTALSGIYDQRVVDAGGVQANKLVCRSSNNLAVICPANTTQGVLGVALSTVAQGGTVNICWAAHCNVISTNNTTAGHWLIPSTTIAGEVDDTGSTTAPTGTQTFLAESTVSGGLVVATTILSPDTVGNNSSGSGGITGSGTVNTIAKFISTSSEGNSSVTDDGVNPTRAPNGINTALNAIYDEWTVDTGGVIANKLACRSSVNKAVICPAGASTTVIGVAQATVSAGGTVLVGWGGRLNVIAANNTTAGDWLIPSVTVAGAVDDTGSPSQPTTGVQTFLALTTVLAGNAVALTLLTPDTLNASGSGKTITFSGGATQPTVNFNSTTPAPGAGFLATTYAFSNSGTTSNAISKFAISGTTSTVVSAGTLSGTSGTCLDGSGNLTTVGCSFGSSGYTTIDNNGVAVTQRSILNFIPSSGASVSCVDNSGATRTDCTVSGGIGGIVQSWVNIVPPYTVQNSDNSQRLRATSGGTITLPQPGTISSSALVADRVASTGNTSSSFTSSSYSQTGGNQMFVTISQYTGANTSTVSTVTNGFGDTCTKVSESVVVGSNSGVSNFYCPNLTNGTTTLSVTFAGTPSTYAVIAEELTGTTFGNSTAQSGGGLPTTFTLTSSIPFTNAVVLFGSRTGSFVNSAGWTEYDTIGNGSIASTYFKYLQNVASITTQQAGANNGWAAQTILSVTGIPQFSTGYWVTIENASSSSVTVSPTSSTINGQNSLNMAPNQSCTFLSNGANWDAICYFAPSLQTNGVIGGAVTISAADQTAGTSSISATTLYGTPAAPVGRYMMTGYADVTVAGTSCASNTTVVLNAIFTDPNAASATTLALGTFTITTNGTVGTSNFSYPPVYFKAKASTNIQFSTTYTAGGSCSPAPTVQVTPILQEI